MTAKSTLERQVTSVLRSLRQRRTRELGSPPRPLAGLRRAASAGRSPGDRPSVGEALAPVVPDGPKAA